MEIEDIHPMRHMARMDHILPFLKPFRKCRKQKKEFHHALRESLLADMNIKMPKNDKKIAEDPFLILGYGVNAYFDIILSLCYMCIVISLFALPLFKVYSDNGV
jgi:hypothetical protein